MFRTHRPGNCAWHNLGRLLLGTATTVPWLVGTARYVLGWPGNLCMACSVPWLVGTARYVPDWPGNLCMACSVPCLVGTVRYIPDWPGNLCIACSFSDRLILGIPGTAIIVVGRSINHDDRRTEDATNHDDRCPENAEDMAEDVYVAVPRVPRTWPRTSSSCPENTEDMAEDVYVDVQSPPQPGWQTSEAGLKSRLVNVQSYPKIKVGKRKIILKSISQVNLSK